MMKKESIIPKWLFKIIHLPHFRNKDTHGRLYIKSIVKVISWRAALIESYDGQRSRAWFYFKLFGKQF
jgi:hypothetical protein